MIEHVLKNTGSRAIRSSVYNHNFLVFGNQAPGPDLVTRTAYEIKSEHPPAKEIGAIRGKELVFLKTLDNKERLVTSLTGFGSSPSDFDFQVEQRGAGSGVRITGDHALQDVSVWSIRTVFALEPFVALNIEPGAETKWTLTYDYYTLSGPAKQGPTEK